MAHARPNSRDKMDHYPDADVIGRADSRTCLTPSKVSVNLANDMSSLESGGESIDGFLERASRKVRVRILCTLCACNACDAVETMSVGFILNKLGEASDSQKTILAASVFVGMTIGGLLAGFIANRIGRKRVLIAALILEGIAALVGAVMPSISFFILARIVSGFGIGATVPVLFILIPEVVAPTCREAYVTYVSGAFAFGSVFVGMLAYICFEGFGTTWRMYYGLTSIWPFVTALLVASTVPESPVYLAKKRKMDKLKESLSYLNPGATTNQLRNVTPQATDFGMQESASRSFASAVQGFLQEDKTMKIRLMIISFVIAWVWYGLSTWAVSIFHNLGTDNPYLSALFFVVCGAIGSLTCIAMVQAMGMKPYILLTFFISTVSACLSIFFTSLTLAVVLACVTNTAISGLFNAVVTYQSVVPLHDRPLSMGFFGATMRVGSIGAQFVMGYYQAAERQWIIHVVSTALLGFAMSSAITLPKINTAAEFKRLTRSAPDHNIE